MKSDSGGLIREYNSKLLVVGQLIDMLVIGFTLWAVLDIRTVAWADEHTWWLLISILSFYLFASFMELYKENRSLPLRQEIRKIITAWGCSLTILAIMAQFSHVISPLNEENFLLWMIAVPIELLSWHIIRNRAVRIARKMGRNTRKVAIVGATRLGGELLDVFSSEDWMGLDFMGFFDDRDPSRDNVKQVVSGKINELIAKAKTGEVDIIYITLALKAEDRIKLILAELADTTASVYYVPDLFVFDLLRSNINYIKGIPVFSVYDTPFYGVDGAAKRAFDIIVGSFILLLIAIPMLLIAIAVKLTSPGNVLFKQRRYGFRGEEITVWKFRSMSVTEDGDKVLQAQRNDPRVTKLGAFLRRTSLDELPQFINVLQGRMSIVGPRPHAVAHNEIYRGQIQGYMLRHKVKPGITGLAQISGFRGETDTLDKMEGRIKYDLQYIRNWSLLSDFKIVFFTVFKCFAGDKVY